MGKDYNLTYGETREIFISLVDSINFYQSALASGDELLIKHALVKIDLCNQVIIKLGYPPVTIGGN